MIIGRKLVLILLKIWFDSNSDPVYYFRLATESDDSVAKSVEFNFYHFANKISL